MYSFQFRPLAEDDGKIDSHSCANLMLFCGTNFCCICHVTGKHGVDGVWNWNYKVAFLDCTKILYVIIADEFNDSNRITGMTLGKLLVACMALKFPSSVWNPIYSSLSAHKILPLVRILNKLNPFHTMPSFTVRSSLILLFYVCIISLSCACFRSEYWLHYSYSCIVGAGSHTGRTATNIYSISPFWLQVCPRIHG
jgi:hypothetical protein